MQQLIINFTRPLTHDMDYTQLIAAFTITISGPRASYSLQWDMNKQEWPAGTYLSQVTFNLSVESTLYGIETLKLQYNNQMGFFDNNTIPLGGAGFLKTGTYPYSYLSPSDAATTGAANGTASQSSIVSTLMMIGI